MSLERFGSEFGAVIAKIEATEGTDPTPVLGTDDLVVMRKPTITQAVQHGSILLESPRGGRAPAPVVSRAATFSMELPYYGAGVDTDVVQRNIIHNVILQTCGDLDGSGGSPAGSELVWTPSVWRTHTFTDDSGTVTETGSTFTMYGYMTLRGRSDSGTTKLVKATNCRVSELTFNLAANGNLTISVSGPCIASEPIDQTLADPGVDLLDYAPTFEADFIANNGLTTTFGLTSDSGNAHTTDASALNIRCSFNASHVTGDSSAGGVAHTSPGDISVTCGFDPIIPLQSTLDYWGFVFDPRRLDSGSIDPAFISTSSIKPDGRSAGSGYGIEFDIPALQILGEYDRSGPDLRMQANGTAVDPDFSGTFLEVKFT